MPPGIVGELCIAGPCVAKGYVGLPELSSKCFIDWQDQSAPDSPPVRMYCTGIDFARNLQTKRV